MSKRKEVDNEELFNVIRMAQLDFASLRTTLIEIVMRLIVEANERVKISLILPRLIENRGTLVKVLTGTEYESAIRLVDDFFRRRDVILKEQRKPLEDLGMIRIIDYFQRNAAMYHLFPNFMKHLPQESQKLLKCFGKLLDMAQAHLERDALTQIKHERYLQRVCKEREKLMVDIRGMEKRRIALMAQQKIQADAKASNLAKIEEHMKIKKKQHNEAILSEADRCRRIVSTNLKASKEKQAELLDELEKLRYEDEKDSREYKKLEKEGRDEKNKLQIQLQGLIKKYDTVIGEKLIENLELNDKLNEANKELSAFMVTYRKEAAIYNEIVAKREREEERRKQAAILKYSMNRAAAKIQRYWKAWRKHMAKKSRKESKGKKGKKK